MSSQINKSKNSRRLDQGGFTFKWRKFFRELKKWAKKIIRFIVIRMVFEVLRFFTWGE